MTVPEQQQRKPQSSSWPSFLLSLPQLPAVRHHHQLPLSFNHRVQHRVQEPFPTGPPPPERRSFFLSVDTGNKQPAEWINSGMTAACWHLSLFCFLLPSRSLPLSVRPGATDLCRPTHTHKHTPPKHSHHLLDVRLCPQHSSPTGGRLNSQQSRFMCMQTGMFSHKPQLEWIYLKNNTAKGEGRKLKQASDNTEWQHIMQIFCTGTFTV